MGVRNYYVITEETPVTKKDIKKCLAQTSLKFDVDADIIARKVLPEAEPDYENDLMLGQFQIEKLKMAYEKAIEITSENGRMERKTAIRSVGIYRMPKD